MHFIISNNKFAHVQGSVFEQFDFFQIVGALW